MSPSALIVIGILSPMSGIIGSLVWPMIQRRFGWTNLRVIVTLVCLASFLPAYGCLGFLPLFRDGYLKFGGLTTAGEMYGLAVYFVSPKFTQGIARCHGTECLHRALSMAHFRATLAHSIQSFYLMAKRLDGLHSFWICGSTRLMFLLGMLCGPSQTRYASPSGHIGYSTADMYGHRSQVPSWVHWSSVSLQIRPEISVTPSSSSCAWCGWRYLSC